MNRPPLQEAREDLHFTTKDELLRRYSDARLRTAVAGELRSIFEDNERLYGEIRSLKARIVELETQLKSLCEIIPVPAPVFATRSSEIVKVVCKRFRVSRTDLLSSRRPQNISAPRQLAMALMCRLTLLSTPQIGRVMGGLDHTTVMHARDKFRKLLDELELTPETDVATWVSDAAKAMGR